MVKLQDNIAMDESKVENMQDLISELDQSALQDSKEVSQNDIEDTKENSQPKGSEKSYRLTVEPAVFLFLAATSVSYTVIQTLYLQRVCEQDLNLNESLCSNLNDTQRTIEQPHAANLLMGKTLLEALLPAALSLFLGPWSDRHGRKPLLLIPMLGHATTFGLYAGLSTIPNLPPRYLIAASVPIAITGGFIAVILSAYSYVADVSPVNKRGLRLSLVDVSVSLSSIVGNAACAPLFNTYGYVAVFATSSALCVLGFFYVLLFLPESVQWTSNNSGDTQSNTVCVFFQQTILEVFRTSFRWRPNYGRAIVLLCACTLGIVVIVIIGDGGMMYMYANKKFGWHVEDYTRLTIVSLVMSVFGTFGVLYLCVKVLRIAEPVVATFGLICKLAGSVLTAISPTAWFLYAAAVAAAFGGMSAPLIRSIMSKTVQHDEVGSVFSLTASLEAITPLIASPLYTAVFNTTLATFSGAFSFMSAAFYAFDVTLLLAVVILQRKASRSVVYEHVSQVPVNEVLSEAGDA